MAELDVVQRLQAWAVEQGADFGLSSMDDPRGYRHRARLAIRGNARSPWVGIFEAGSHRVVHIPRCLVHHPRVNATAADLVGAIRQTRLRPYADGSHRGLLRYVQILVDARGERVQLMLVTCSDSPDPAARLWPMLSDCMGQRLQGLFWNGQPERSNAIVGPRTERIAGEPAMPERFGGAQVFFPPDAFCQNNPRVYAQIVAKVRGWVPADADVLELYAGVGALGLSVLPRARRVRFNEVAPGSLAGLQMGLDALPPSQAGRTQVLPGRAGDWAAAVGECDVLIVDPPRKGLDPEVLTALSSDGPGPRELLYVSCGPAALMAEATQLAPRFRLRELHLFDLFPWTGHVEAVARFARA